MGQLSAWVGTSKKNEREISALQWDHYLSFSYVQLLNLENRYSDEKCAKYVSEKELRKWVDEKSLLLSAPLAHCWCPAHSCHSCLLSPVWPLVLHDNVYMCVEKCSRSMHEGHWIIYLCTQPVTTFKKGEIAKTLAESREKYVHNEFLDKKPCQCRYETLIDLHTKRRDSCCLLSGESPPLLLQRRISLRQYAFSILIDFWRRM